MKCKYTEAKFIITKQNWISIHISERTNDHSSKEWNKNPVSLKARQAMNPQNHKELVNIIIYQQWFISTGELVEVVKVRWQLTVSYFSWTKVIIAVQKGARHLLYPDKFCHKLLCRSRCKPFSTGTTRQKPRKLVTSKKEGFKGGKNLIAMGTRRNSV